MIKFLTGAALAGITAIAMLLVATTTATVEANVLGISASQATVNPSATGVVITIDAEEGDGDVRVLATAGDFEVCTDVTSAADCLLEAGTAVVDAAALAAGTTDTDFTVNDAGGTPAVPVATNTDLLQVTWDAPTTGPQTVTITAIQDTVAKSVTVAVRGTADKVTFRILSTASVSTTLCEGSDAKVIRAVGATAGLTNGVLCTVVTDSAGNRLPNAAVIYSTDRGTITGLTDTTGATGQRATASTIAAGSTGTQNTKATVTASAGGKTATAEVKFGGDPASCTLTATPGTVQVGGSSAVVVDVKDAAGGPVPDAQVINVAQANSGQGANAAILNAAPTTLDGKASTTAIAAIQGAIALGASSATQNPGATCTGSLIAQSTIATPTGTATGTATPGAGPGTITGDKPPASGGGIALFVFNGGTNAQLVAASGCNPATASFYVTQNGVFITYVPGTAIGAVNADWMAKFPGGNIPANTPIMGKCA